MPPSLSPLPLADMPLLRSDVDWARVAYLLARGVPMTKVALDVGCSRWTLWRVLERSNILRRRLDEEQTRYRTEQAQTLKALTERALDIVQRRLAKDDAAMARWTIDRQKLWSLELPTAHLDAAAAAALATAGAADAEHDIAVEWPLEALARTDALACLKRASAQAARLNELVEAIEAAQAVALPAPPAGDPANATCTTKGAFESAPAPDEDDDASFYESDDILEHTSPESARGAGAAAGAPDGAGPRLSGPQPAPEPAA